MNKKKEELKDRLKQALALREKKSVDLCRDLNIPKSAISQYLSGKSQNMDSERLYAICKYLNVSEPWLLGYDVPMGRETQEKNDTLVRIVKRMRFDEEFLSLVDGLCNLEQNKLNAIKQMLSVLK